MRSIFFAGTFAPFTIGHDDLVQRALKLFDEVVIGIGVNYTKAQSGSRSAIAALYRDTPRVRVVTYNGVTAEKAIEEGCCALLRGVRDIKDYEYERQMADVNRALTGIETVLLTARPELGYISSTLLRDLESHHKDITPYLPIK